MVALRLYLRAKPILWRALICWALGSILLVNDEVNSFDARFQIRGARPANTDIVIITLHPDEVNNNNALRGRLSTWKDVVDFTDSYYWDPMTWKNLLGKVLGQKPRSVGVSLYFPEGLSKGGISQADLPLFRDKRIVWATPSTGGDRSTVPLFANATMSNTGSFDLLRDEDGVIRRFYPGLPGLSHLAEKVAKQDLSGASPKIINYQGGNHSWTEFTLSEVLDPGFPKDALFGKIVIIGSATDSNAQYLTPFGATHRANIMAHITDNLLEHRWIHRAPTPFYILALFFLLFISVFVLIQYPQAVAGALFVWLGTMLAALSIWIFDSYCVWIPVFSPLVQMAATWTVFLGYQANKFERKNNELRQEQRASLELEQLKNNFVSLISHDLKTPIAKIQGVTDRMIFENPETPFKEDLGLLRQYSEELNRYIKSILKVLQVESREFRLSLEVGDINEMIETAIDPLIPLASLKEIKIEKKLDPLFSFEGDFNLLREVVMNVVENAIKYSPAGSLVQIRSFEVDDSIFIEVKDQGPGIPKDEINEVWRKFVRGKDQDLKTKGTGLGLYLVKYFIELHGGSVSLESEVGKGTAITLQLPLETAVVSKNVAAEHLAAENVNLGTAYLASENLGTAYLGSENLGTDKSGTKNLEPTKSGNQASGGNHVAQFDAAKDLSTYS